MKFETLKEALSNWSDVDSARFAIAICLGLMRPETNCQRDAKHVFWSNHPVGSLLYDFLIRLVELGALEHREGKDDDEYRWNPSFKGSWE